MVGRQREEKEKEDKVAKCESGILASAKALLGLNWSICSFRVYKFSLPGKDHSLYRISLSSSSYHYGGQSLQILFVQYMFAER